MLTDEVGLAILPAVFEWVNVVRVLFVHDIPGFHGGAERWVYQSARGLGSRRGFECHLAHTQASGLQKDEFSSAFAKSHYVRRISCWTRLVQRVKPDVVCASNLPPEHFEALADVVAPRVRIVHDHELSCLSGKRLFTWSGAACDRVLGRGCWACLGFVGRRHGRFQLNRLASKQRALELTGRLDAVVVLSRYMRSELIRAGIAEDRLTVIPPGIDEPATADAPPRGSNGIRLLFAGQVIRGKGLDLLLRAMPLLPDRCELVVAGTGNALAKNRELARRLKISHRVRFLGWQPAEKVERLYAEADVVVVPSRWPEPFGLVGIEAMSHSRPVVAFDVGGISDWLEHGTTGLLVSAADAVGLANALNSLSASSPMRRQMGRAGRDAFLKKFTIEVMLDRLAACFDRVAGANSNHASQFCDRTELTVTA
jgi:glycosyltransferase involved in cell wall biosynthesis